ncbi:ABC transporter ATP-binding protein [Halorussus salinisoli]|uniref:ABC transporter ATP-binding protein n=1 Tax=Halorussus salinisoli TaxID=2558242 RepID=UPI001484F6DB|nr:ABC transporter ATP-binding protein [Halorussus salinisoli]
MTDQALLETRELRKYFSQSSGLLDSFLGNEDHVQAVDDVSLTVDTNEVIGIIGESGCGKTTLLELLIGLHEPTGGEIRFQGDRLSTFDRKDWKRFRRNVQIIFQDPFNSLDPKMTVRESLREPLAVHGLDDKTARIRRALENAELDPDTYLDRLPRQLSGGEKQRVSIARALVTEPDMILADEPASMLDVSTQASVLNLLNDLSTELGVSIIYISHDLSTVGHVCDRINVMYLGRIVESAPTEQLLHEPKHPYTEALVNAIPIPDPHHNRPRTKVEGTPRDPINLGEGCRFRDRCPERMDICDRTPRTTESDADHQVACHLYYEHEEVGQ